MANKISNIKLESEQTSKRNQDMDSQKRDKNQKKPLTILIGFIIGVLLLIAIIITTTNFGSSNHDPVWENISYNQDVFEESNIVINNYIGNYFDYPLILEDEVSSINNDQEATPDYSESSLDDDSLPRVQREGLLDNKKLLEDIAKISEEDLIKNIVYTDSSVESLIYPYPYYGTEYDSDLIDTSIEELQRKKEELKKGKNSESRDFKSEIEAYINASVEYFDSEARLAEVQKCIQPELRILYALRDYNNSLYLNYESLNNLNDYVNKLRVLIVRSQESIPKIKTCLTNYESEFERNIELEKVLEQINNQIKLIQEKSNLLELNNQKELVFCNRSSAIGGETEAGPRCLEPIGPWIGEVYIEVYLIEEYMNREVYKYGQNSEYRLKLSLRKKEIENLYDKLSKKYN